MISYILGASALALPLTLAEDPLNVIHFAFSSDSSLSGPVKLSPKAYSVGEKVFPFGLDGPTVLCAEGFGAERVLRDDSNVWCVELEVHDRSCEDSALVLELDDHGVRD